MYLKYDKICILMGVFNGADYLRNQLDSILGQSFTNWELLIRDDGSQDKSVQILEQYATKYPRIKLIKDVSGNLGVIGNFTRLMQRACKSSCPYVAFSDQDDIWSPDKLFVQLSAMKHAEFQRGHGPVLVYCDMAVVNEMLRRVAPSFMQYQGIYHAGVNPLKTLLIQNFVTGCSMLINKNLLELSLPVPQEVLMHDWWIALCAAVFGHIEFIKTPLVQYRQHQNNVVGAKSFDSLLNPLGNRWWKIWSDGKKNLSKSVEQAKVLEKQIQRSAPLNSYLPLINIYASLTRLSALDRIISLQHAGIRFQSRWRQILMLSRILFLSEK